MASGWRCPAEVDGGTHQCRLVVGQVGFAPRCSGLHPPPPPTSSSPAFAVRVHQGQEEGSHPFLFLWPAAILKYFSRELPPPGGPGPSVGAKRARVEAPTCAHAIPCLYSNNCLPFHSQAVFCPFLFFCVGCLRVSANQDGRLGQRGISGRTQNGSCHARAGAGDRALADGAASDEHQA